jgi:hypothetical protein
MTDPDVVASLRADIEGKGAPDKYIDADEEREIYEKGEELGIQRPAVEAVLNQMCQSNSWTRELDIIDDVRDQLEEATKDDGVIDQREFEHCINYAVAMNMPRRRAMELSVEFIQANRLSIKKARFRKDWFEPLRQQYGR